MCLVKELKRLIQYIKYQTNKAEELTDFFATHQSVEVDPMHTWNAHTCYIRETLIKLGKNRKKMRGQKVDKILT